MLYHVLSWFIYVLHKTIGPCWSFLFSAQVFCRVLGKFGPQNHGNNAGTMLRKTHGKFGGSSFLRIILFTGVPPMKIELFWWYNWCRPFGDTPSSIWGQPICRGHPQLIIIIVIIIRFDVGSLFWNAKFVEHVLRFRSCSTQVTRSL